MRGWMVLNDGTVKALDWRGVDALLDSSPSWRVDNPADAYILNPWVRRCVELRASAVSSIPYTVRSGESDVPFPSLARLLADTERWLCIAGAAYWLIGGTRRRPELRMLNALTMRVERDASAGIRWFEQTVGGSTVRFEPESIVYFRTFNPRDDLGPGVPPISAVLTSAKLGELAGSWAAAFFERAAIPPVILTTDAYLSEQDRTEIRSVWDRMTAGLKNAWRIMVLGGGVKPVIVGSPVKDVAMAELMTQIRQQIAVAFGIPQTLLEDAANYATARQHWVSFWNETIIPEAMLIQDALNDQLMRRLGLTFEFEFRQIEALQQDEAEKADAVVKLVQAGIMTVDEARQQMDLAVKQEAPPGQEAVQIRALLYDLQRWRDKVKRNNAPVEFKSDVIPQPVMELVEGRLRDGGDAFSFLKLLRIYADGVKVEPNRAVEAELRRRVQDVFEKYFELVIAGRASEAEALAALVGMDDELRAAVEPLLVKTVEDAVIAEAMIVGLYPDVVAINQAAVAWASGYTYELIKGITDTTRKAVSRAVMDFLSTPGMTVEDLTMRLEPVFGRLRAEMIATTEVTRAYAQASLIYQELLKEWGLVMVRVWHTSNDERVCPICGPNEGKPEGAWTVPDGPPAHPNCRCWTTLKLSGAR